MKSGNDNDTIIISFYNAPEDKLVCCEYLFSVLHLIEDTFTQSRVIIYSDLNYDLINNPHDKQTFIFTEHLSKLNFQILINSQSNFTRT